MAFIFAAQHRGMKQEPLRTLITGYGLAGIAGASSGAAFGSLLVGGLVFWLGGAVLTLGLAGMRGIRADRADGAVTRTEDPRFAAEREASARRWDQDLRDSRPPAPRKAG